MTHAEATCGTARDAASDLARALGRLQQGAHGAVLYDTLDELLQVSAPFYRIGRERHEQCVYLADPDTLSAIGEALSRQGWDVEDEQRRERLVLMSARGYLVDDRFDPQAMLRFLRRSVHRSTAQGFAGLRSMGDMLWQLGPDPDRARLVEYEPMLEAAARELPYVGLCLYRRADHPAELLEEILGAHGAAAVGLDLVTANPVQRPPQLAVGGDGASTEGLDWKTAAIRRAAQSEREADEQLIASAAERRAAVEALLANERRLRTLTELVPQLVWTAAPGGRLTWVSPQWTEYTGRSLDEALGERWLEAVHPDDRAATQAAWSGATSGETLSIEHRLRRGADGAHRWFRTRATFLDAEQGAGAWFGTSTDVDDLKRLHERQHVLLAELQHRTRNLLAVVGSLVHQTLDTSEDLKGFETSFDQRLAALSRVQGLVARTDPGTVSLGDLVRMELDAMGAKASDRIVLDGPEIALPSGALETLALALHELATNALKYGALVVPGGRLEVRWRTEGPEGRRRLSLQWHELGLDREREERSPTRRGYGRELIERGLPYQLGARTSFELTSDAVHCSIEIPLA